MLYKHGKICHPEPLFFGGEGSPKTQSEGFFRLAKNASLQNDILGAVFPWLEFRPNCPIFKVMYII